MAVQSPGGRWAWRTLQTSVTRDCLRKKTSFAHMARMYTKAYLFAAEYLIQPHTNHGSGVLCIYMAEILSPTIRKVGHPIPVYTPVSPKEVGGAEGRRVSQGGTKKDTASSPPSPTSPFHLPPIPLFLSHRWALWRQKASSHRPGHPSTTARPGSLSDSSPAPWASRGSRK